MTNHIEKALASLKPLFKPQTISVEEGNAQLHLAQAYASIAIAEQLRIANLIALGSKDAWFGTAAEAARAVETSHHEPGGHRRYALKPDIAEALGIGGDSDD